MKTLFTLLVLCSVALCTRAEEITLAWKPSTLTNVAGYHVRVAPAEWTNSSPCCGYWYPRKPFGRALFRDQPTLTYNFGDAPLFIIVNAITTNDGVWLEQSHTDPYFFRPSANKITLVP